jgi:hypothetical protein
MLLRNAAQLRNASQSLRTFYLTPALLPVPQALPALPRCLASMKGSGLAIIAAPA